MSIPDCTLVTCCFCVHNKNEHAFSIEKIEENAEELMKLPCYLVIFCDEITYPLLKQKRTSYGVEDMTQFIVTDLKQLWTYQYEDKVNKNREEYWPTRDARAQTDSHLITCNKFDFVLQIIESDPFKTSKFGWIDCFIRKNAAKISENYTPNMIPYILHNVTDKFHIQVLNVNDKKYKKPENKREFYQQYRYVICGCLFTCGKEIGKKVLTRGRELFIETTEAGFGHSEEMLYLEMLDEFPDDIIRSYGDYNQILNNFIKPTRNIYYIYHMILKRYFDFGYHKECYDCGKILMEQMRNYIIHVEPDLQFQILFHFYISTYYHKHHEAKEIAQYIKDICEENPYFKKEFNKNSQYYKDQLKYVIDF